jgi:hypothetical protein
MVESSESEYLAQHGRLSEMILPEHSSSGILHYGRAQLKMIPNAGDFEARSSNSSISALEFNNKTLYVHSYRDFKTWKLKAGDSNARDFCIF